MSSGTGAPLSILTVVPVMGVGGAEVVAATLVRAARDQGHDVVLASGGGFRADALAAEGVEHVELPLATRRPSDLLRAVRILRRRPRPDVVHAHNVKAAVVARLGVGRRVPVVVTVHGVPAEQWRTSARVLARVATRVVAVSPHVRDRLVEHGLPAERAHVVENAVVPVPQVDPSAARELLHLPDDAPVVLCLARLVPQKRHDLLVAAWAHVLERWSVETLDPARPGATAPVLLVAGDGPTRAAVEAQAAVACPPGSVRFLGARQDAEVLLAAADVVALATDWEGLPISLLEAMSAGVPVVATAVGGVVETLGSAVRLVEPDSIAAFATALTELVTDPDARKEHGDRGRALVATRFPLDRMVDGHDAATREVVGTIREEVRS